MRRTALIALLACVGLLVLLMQWQLATRLDLATTGTSPFGSSPSTTSTTTVNNVVPLSHDEGEDEPKARRSPYHGRRVKAFSSSSSSSPESQRSTKLTSSVSSASRADQSDEKKGAPMKEEEGLSQTVFSWTRPQSIDEYIQLYQTWVKQFGSRHNPRERKATQMASSTKDDEGRRLVHAETLPSEPQPLWALTNRYNASLLLQRLASSLAAGANDVGDDDDEQQNDGNRHGSTMERALDHHPPSSPLSRRAGASPPSGIVTAKILFTTTLISSPSADGDVQQQRQTEKNGPINNTTTLNHTAPLRSALSWSVPEITTAPNGLASSRRASFLPAADMVSLLLRSFCEAQTKHMTTMGQHQASHQQQGSPSGGTSQQVIFDVYLLTRLSLSSSSAQSPFTDQRIRKVIDKMSRSCGNRTDAEADHHDAQAPSSALVLTLHIHYVTLLTAKEPSNHNDEDPSVTNKAQGKVGEEVPVSLPQFQRLENSGELFRLVVNTLVRSPQLVKEEKSQRPSPMESKEMSRGAASSSIIWFLSNMVDPTPWLLRGEPFATVLRLAAADSVVPASVSGDVAAVSGVSSTLWSVCVAFCNPLSGSSCSSSSSSPLEVLADGVSAHIDGSATDSFDDNDVANGPAIVLADRFRGYSVRDPRVARNEEAHVAAGEVADGAEFLMPSPLAFGVTWDLWTAFDSWWSQGEKPKRKGRRELRKDRSAWKLLQGNEGASHLASMDFGWIPSSTGSGSVPPSLSSALHFLLFATTGTVNNNNNGTVRVERMQGYVELRHRRAVERAATSQHNGPIRSGLSLNALLHVGSLHRLHVPMETYAAQKNATALSNDPLANPSDDHARDNEIAAQKTEFLRRLVHRHLRPRWEQVGAIIDWETFCIPCFGFTNEVMHYIAPLEQQGVLVRSSNAKDSCFCPGMPTSFEQSLHRAVEGASIRELGEWTKDVRVPSLGDLRIEDGGNRGRPLARVRILHKDPGSYPTRWGGRQKSPVPRDTPREIWIGRSMYEFNKLPAHWLAHQEEIDELWVPSEYVRWVFLDNGCMSGREAHVVVIPEPIDVWAYDPLNAGPQLALPLVHVASTSAGSSSSWPPEYNWAHASNVKLAASDLLPSGSNVNRGGRGPHEELRQYYKFFSVFKWEERKGWEVLLRAYFAEFAAITPTTTTTVAPDGAADSVREGGEGNEGNHKDAAASRAPVSLYLATYIYGENGRHPDRILDRIADFAKAEFPHLSWPVDFPHVQIISEEIDERNMIRLYGSVDAFVLPTRGEGWGLPVIQAMSMALPTLVTDWSGVQDFASDENSFLIPVENVSAVPGDAGYGAAEAGKVWGNPSTEVLRRHMRFVATHPEEGKKIGRRARGDIVRRFSDEVVAEIVKRRIRTLLAELDAAEEQNLPPHGDDNNKNPVNDLHRKAQRYVRANTDDEDDEKEVRVGMEGKFDDNHNEDDSADDDDRHGAGDARVVGEDAISSKLKEAMEGALRLSDHLVL